MIYWIFGGTAVGKKTYILHHRDFAPACWMEDEDRLFADLVNDLRGGDRLVRWQWAREHVVANIAEHVPDLQQTIVLLTATLDVQADRAATRDPGKFTLEQLGGEARSVRWLALGVAAEYGLPVVAIDISSDDKTAWRAPA